MLRLLIAPSPSPPLTSFTIETKEKSHLKMLRLWCELCVIVCPCFLDDPDERGPYLNTRKNKKTLCNQTPWSLSFSYFSRRCFGRGGPAFSLSSNQKTVSLLQHTFNMMCLRSNLTHFDMVYIHSHACGPSFSLSFVQFSHHKEYFTLQLYNALCGSVGAV